MRLSFPGEAPLARLQKRRKVSQNAFTQRRSKGCVSKVAEAGCTLVWGTFPPAQRGDRRTAGPPSPRSSQLPSWAPAGPAPFRRRGALLVAAARVRGKTQGSVTSRETHHVRDLAVTGPGTPAQKLRWTALKWRHRTVEGRGPGRPTTTPDMLGGITSRSVPHYSLSPTARRGGAGSRILMFDEFS